MANRYARSGVNSAVTGMLDTPGSGAPSGCLVGTSYSRTLPSKHEGLLGRRAPDVPDDDAVVLAGGDGDAPVGAEGSAEHRAVMASGSGSTLPGDEVDEAH
jgi:hypothetical protein